MDFSVILFAAGLLLVFLGLICLAFVAVFTEIAVLRKKDASVLNKAWAIAAIFFIIAIGAAFAFSSDYKFACPVWLLAIISGFWKGFGANPNNISSIAFRASGTMKSWPVQRVQFNINTGEKELREKAIKYGTFLAFGGVIVIVIIIFLAFALKK